MPRPGGDDHPQLGVVSPPSSRAGDLQGVIELRQWEW